MPSHLAKVEADVQRVQKLMRDLAERCYGLAEERGEENFRFETLGIVAVVSFDDEGSTAEDTVAIFETKRYHVQTGILVDLLDGRKESRYERG